MRDKLQAPQLCGIESLADAYVGLNLQPLGEPGRAADQQPQLLVQRTGQRLGKRGHQDAGLQLPPRVSGSAGTGKTIEQLGQLILVQPKGFRLQHHVDAGRAVFALVSQELLGVGHGATRARNTSCSIHALCRPGIFLRWIEFSLRPQHQCR